MLIKRIPESVLPMYYSRLYQPPDNILYALQQKFPESYLDILWNTHREKLEMLYWQPPIRVEFKNPSGSVSIMVSDGRPIVLASFDLSSVGYHHVDRLQIEVERGDKMSERLEAEEKAREDIALAKEREDVRHMLASDYPTMKAIQNARMTPDGKGMSPYGHIIETMVKKECPVCKRITDQNRREMNCPACGYSDKVSFYQSGRKKKIVDTNTVNKNIIIAKH